MIARLMHAAADGMTTADWWLLVGLMVVGHGLGILVRAAVASTLEWARDVLKVRGLRLDVRRDFTGGIPMWRCSIETRDRLVVGIHQWQVVAFTQALGAWARPRRAVRFE